MVLKRSSALIGCCFRFFHSQDSALYLSFYFKYVLPRIDYCFMFYLYSLKYTLVSIEKLQRRFTRKLFLRVFRGKPVTPYEERLAVFDIQKLAIRYLVTLYKILNGLIVVPSLVVTFSPCVPHRLILPSTNTTIFKNSFFHRSVVSWNLYVKSQIHSLPEFKRYSKSVFNIFLVLLPFFRVSLSVNPCSLRVKYKYKLRALGAY